MHDPYAAWRPNIKQQPPRQDSIYEQLKELWTVAAKLGMYDAADWLWKNGNLESKI
jgi:hypothetical protein